MKRHKWFQDFGRGMGRRVWLLGLVCALTLLLAPARPAAAAGTDPDLVVTALSTSGTPTILSSGMVRWPVTVTVKNTCGFRLGPPYYVCLSAGTGEFKVALDYRDSAGTWSIAFAVWDDASTDNWYGWVPSLGPDSSRTLHGYAFFPKSARGKTVKLIATADSCSGDEFMPAYCRVLERYETNNSLSILRTLPA
jgi:hypothetical protein